MFIPIIVFIAVRLVLRGDVKIRLERINQKVDVIGEPSDAPNLKNTDMPLEEEPFLFDTTVFLNIKYGKISAADEEVTAAAERAGIAYLLEENADNLTKGERQLVAAARAILFHPRRIIVGKGLSAVDLLSVKNLDLQ
jgi:ABC-type sugar transport system ATPase subunit